MTKETDSFRVTITNSFSEGECFSGRVRILFVIEGTVKLELLQDTYSLDKEDFVIVNRNRFCRAKADSGYLLAVIEADYSVLQMLSGRNSVSFRCNSAVEDGVKYEKFRYLIGELLNEYAIDYRTMTFMKVSAFYKLCHYMVQYFAAAEKKDSGTRVNIKIENALAYLDECYHEKISLEEVAKKMYMTPTSFSRFFHRETGITYMEYLNLLRLNDAEERLLYSAETVTEIALESGFTNISSFNRLFKNTYGVSPKRYREEWTASDSTQKKTSERTIEKSLEKYKNKTRTTIVREQKIRDLHIHAALNEGRELKNPWIGAIHFGHISRLLSAEYQNQISFLKKELRLEYGCLTGIFSKELMLRNGSDTENLNFSYLDNALDCLVRNGIHPILMLDNHSLSLVKDSQLQEFPEYDSKFENYEECVSVIRKLIRHFIYRYGEEEVQCWMFELLYDGFEGAVMGLQEDFNLVWDAVYECIRQLLPGAKIGGSGVGTSFEYVRLQEFFHHWTKAEHRPDFISLYGFPYSWSEEQTVRRKLDVFLDEEITEMKNVRRDVGFENLPFYLLEWNVSFVQRNYYNDTSAKAAFLMKLMSQELESIDMGAYWAASDLLSGDVDSSKLLNGACGLLSKDGICKPSFYAVYFMGRLKKYLLSKGENYIVTTDNRGNYVILFFNSKGLNYTYYSKSEAQISVDMTDRIFLDEDAVEITLVLDDVQNGSYYVRKQRIGPECGDALNEWRFLDAGLPVTMNEIYYLKHRCVPHRENDVLTVKNQEMILMERISAHECMLLEITSTVK